MPATSLVNTGAADALVMRLAGTLSAPAGAWMAKVIWSGFPDHPVDPGTPAPGQWSFGLTLSPLIASSRKASTT